MDKSGVVKLADIVISLNNAYQALLALEQQEQKTYDDMSEERQYSVEGEIMIETIEGIDDAQEELGISIDTLRGVLKNNK